MRLLNRVISQLASLNISSTSTNPLRTITNLSALSTYRLFSTKGSGSGSGSIGGFDDNTDWGSAFSSWSTGLTKEHFDGEAVGRQINEGEPASSGAGTRTRTGNENSQFTNNARWTDQEMDILKGLKESYDQENRLSKVFMDDNTKRMMETSVLLKQVQEPGARGSYLKDSEKAEMYKLHKKNPKVYTVEKLAKDYRIMRQRVHAILWLKELEEEEEKKLGHPLDDSVELLLDNFPE